MDGKRILLVEDSVFLAEVYANVLQENGCEVTVVHTGEEGYTKASVGGWHLILLDVVLPGIDGFEIVERLRRDPPQEENGPIVFLTSLDGDNEVERAKKLGCEYIVKSNINPGDLVQFVTARLSPQG